MIEKSMEYYVRALRSDRRDEHLSNEFNAYCKKQGIRRYLTAPYTP
jgi:hypothetical protein